MLTKAKVLDVSEDRLPSVMQALLRDSPNIALAVILSMHLLYLATTGVLLASHRQIECHDLPSR
jgi:hypothetical protein